MSALSARTPWPSLCCGRLGMGGMAVGCARITGLIVAYGYASEHFMAWFSKDEYESWIFFHTRERGPYSPLYWTMLFCNIAVPQLLWFRSVRTHPLAIWIISLVINLGMWLERFVIIVTSLHQDFLPGSWGMYYPTKWDWMTFIGTIGFFVFCLLLFIRFLPAISIFEMRELVHEVSEKEAALEH